MYVDNDVSLLRGFVAGFPKKLAVIDITRSIRCSSPKNLEEWR